MRIGITGGTGQLGRLIGARLLDEGHNVVVFTRDPERARGSVPSRFQLVAWQPVTEPIPPTQLDSLDAVINLVGESVGALWTPARKERIRASRVTATRNLMAGWIRAGSPPKVLLTSSASGYYGDGGDTELTETSPSGDGFLARLCRDWEDAAGPAASVGTRVVTLRTSLPLDPGGGLLGRLIPIFKLGLGAHLGSGRQWLPWIHREDWINLVLFALENPEASGPLNVTTPGPVPSRVFTRALGKAMHRPVLFTAPAWLLGLSSQAREMVLYGQRLVPARARALGFTWRFPELEPALEDLLG